jgi:hypothetical protein
MAERAPARLAGGHGGENAPGGPNARESGRAAGSEGGEGRNRTGDTTVFSRVLYQLSYLAASAHRSP